MIAVGVLLWAVKFRDAASYYFGVSVCRFAIPLLSHRCRQAFACAGHLVTCSVCDVLLGRSDERLGIPSAAGLRRLGAKLLRSGPRVECFHAAGKGNKTYIQKL